MIYNNYFSSLASFKSCVFCIHDKISLKNCKQHQFLLYYIFVAVCK